MKRTGFDSLRDILAPFSEAADSTYDLALGPCAIESEEQLEECAAAAAQYGATYLRGGAIKLRTNLASFHGHGAKAWFWLAEAAKRHGLKSVSEVTRASEVAVAALHLDALQIGARSMWNFELFEACAYTGKTIVLKRGIGATTADWLAAANRLHALGCEQLVLCERGLSSPDGASRNSVDLSILAFLIAEGRLPVWLDVSHSAGDPRVALKLLTCAKAIGLSGAMAEIHPAPEYALCDAEQAIPIGSLVAQPGIQRTTNYA